MKIRNFDRASLPDKITYNEKEYFLLSSSDNIKIISTFCNLKGLKMVQISVLSKRLKGKTDAHSKPYKPNKFIFCHPLPAGDEIAQLNKMLEK